MNEASTPNRYGLTTQVMDLVAQYTKTIFVPSKNFNISQLPIPMVTALKNVRFEIDKANCEDALDYVFATVEPHRTDGFHAFTFVPKFSVQQTRIPVLTTWDSEPYPWPAELLELKFTYDEAFPSTGVLIKHNSNSTTVGASGRVQRASVYTQRSYRDAATVQTKVRFKFYFSNTPFSAGSLESPQPHPTEVFWNFGSSSGRLLCLHDDVTIDAQDLSYAALFGTAFGSEGNRILPAQFFSATNFSKRYPFDIKTCSPTPTKGLFVKVAKRYYPPWPGPITTITE